MQAWEADAICHTHPPDLWFPNSTGAQRKADAARAITICRTCPVLRQCADFALATEMRAGIWGGHDLGNPGQPLSDRKRKALAKTAGRTL
ncbi:WhiB family transcriptional regulator [Nocardia sp. NPDC004068]|uniref:WhiB family transcriptional regulator n=1 Tax=Nocardia sp. NPDC004068 TaxID=3364303 RepID=UPI0036B3D2C9